MKEDYQKGFKKLTLFFFRTACHLYVTRVYLYVIRMPLVRTRMSFVCHLYALVCHPYVTRMYSYVIRISLVCIRISFVCHSYVILCHPYVTRMYSYASRMYSYVLVCYPYVTRMSSVCHSYVVLPWTLLHWLWMLKLCIEVQFTKFMNIFFSSVGITPVKWHKYQEQRRSRRRSTHFCKLSTKNKKSIFLGRRRRRGSSLFIQDFQTNPQIGFRSSGLQRK